MNGNGVLDYVRFIGAIAIVYFHLKLPYSQYGLAALSIFSTLAVYFLARRKEDGAFALQVEKSIHRLMKPWLFWSVIYGLLKIMDATVTQRSPRDEFELWMLLTGPAIHLWYLPFIFVVGLLVSAAKWPLASATAGLAISAIAYLLVCVLNSYLVAHGNLGTPFAQWIAVLPACAFGLVLAEWERSPLRAPAMLTLTLLIYVTPNQLGWNSIGLELLLGSVICTLALNTRFPRTTLSRQLAELSLGVYLVHPLVAAIFWRLPAIFSLEWTTFIGTVVVSILATVLLSRVPVLRQFI